MNKFESVALRLTGDLAKFETACLPSMDTLARQYGVSYRTMWKALNLLKERGLVSVEQGKRSRIHPGGTQDGPDGEEDIGGSARELAFRIGELIQNGTYKTGTRLPKINYFTLTYHVCYKTVIRALGALEKRNLLHRQGNHWIIGPSFSERRPVSERRISLYGQSPVVILVLPNTKAWSSFSSASFAKGFFFSFSIEMERYGMSLLPVLAWSSSRGLPFAVGIEKALQQVESLGRRYYGALFLRQPPPRSETRLGQWLQALARFEKPVVWFDIASSTGDEARDEYLRARRRAGRSSELMYRCCHDVPGAVSMVLEALCGNGHERIGVYYSYGMPWMEERIAIIREKAQALGCAVFPAYDKSGERRLTASGGIGWREIGTIMGEIQSATGRRAFSQIFQKGNQPAERRIRWMLSYNKALSQLLFQDRVTGIISLNDILAQELYAWLLMAGIGISGRVSVVSFDNRIESRIYPISSVDFGLEELGYRTAHLYIGDIPIRRDDRWGNLKGRPVLIDRGSLGRA